MSTETKQNEQDFEELGQLIDSLDNYAHALKLPLTPQTHVEQLSRSLPELTQKFKDVYIKITAENPWA